MFVWYTIKDRPKKDGPYLVLQPKRTLDQYAVQHWDHIEGSFSNDFGISHWAELPPPPPET